MTMLTGTGGGEKIAIRSKMLDVLTTTHGEELEILWRGLFGHGPDCLTDIEGGYLGRVESLAQISARMAEAAARTREAGLPALEIG